MAAGLIVIVSTCEKL